MIVMAYVSALNLSMYPISMGGCGSSAYILGERKGDERLEGLFRAFMLGKLHKRWFISVHDPEITSQLFSPTTFVFPSLTGTTNPKNF